MEYLVRGSGILCNSYAIQGQIFIFFSLTFHVRVFSGNLKLAAQNVSDEEVWKVRSKFRHSLHAVLTLLSSKSSYVLENCLFKHLKSV